MTFDPSFQNLNDALSTSYDSDDEPVKKSKEEILEEMQIRMDSVKKTMSKATYKNAEFMRAEIATTLASTKSVLDTLEQTLKIGASPQYFEKYSFLLNSYINMMREYRQISRDEADVEISERRLSIKEQEVQKNGGGVVNNNLIVMDSKTLLQLATDASKNAKITSSLKEISTDFNIDVNETSK